MEKKYIELVEKMADSLNLNFTYEKENDHIGLETGTDQGEDFIIDIQSDNLADLEHELYDLGYGFDEYEDAEETGNCRGAPDLRHRIESSKEKKEIYKEMYDYIKNIEE